MTYFTLEMSHYYCLDKDEKSSNTYPVDLLWVGEVMSMKPVMWCLAYIKTLVDNYLHHQARTLMMDLAGGYTVKQLLREM